MLGHGHLVPMEKTESNPPPHHHYQVEKGMGLIVVNTVKLDFTGYKGGKEVT